MTINAGDQAPDFKLPASGGREVSLAGQKGWATACFSHSVVTPWACT